MRIESLERRRGQQFCMTLSDGTEYMVDKHTMEESVYTVGSDIDDDGLTALLTASATRRAREYALYLLSVRDFGEKELCRKLREKGYAEEAADTAVRMCELGLVNDEVYARRLARDCRLRKLYSRRRTVQEIAAHGIARELGEYAVEAVDEAENLTDLQQALALLEKKRYTVSVTPILQRRGTALLMRYGYDSRTVREAWRCLEKEIEDNEF